MELTLWSESWWGSGLFWWGVRSTDGRRGNSSSQLHRSSCAQTEHRVRLARAGKVCSSGTKVIELQELVIMTAWRPRIDWNRNKNCNSTETKAPLPKRKKQWLVGYKRWIKSLVGLTSCETWMCLNYADSAENQLTPGKQTAESPEGRKKSQWRNLFWTRPEDSLWTQINYSHCFHFCAATTFQKLNLPAQYRI